MITNAMHLLTEFFIPKQEVSEQNIKPNLPMWTAYSQVTTYRLLLQVLILILLASRVHAGVTTITTCNYTINNGSAYQITGLVGCTPQDWGVRWNFSNANGATLNFTTNAARLGSPSMGICLDVNGADGVVITGHGHSGLSFSQCTGSTTAIKVHNGSIGTVIMNFETAGSREYDLLTMDANVTTTQNVSFGTAGTGVRQERTAGNVYVSVRQGVGLGSKALFTSVDSDSFCISDYRVNNTASAGPALAKLFNIERASLFTMLNLNLTSPTAYKGTYVYIVNSTNFTSIRGYLINATTGVWLVDSNFSEQSATSPCPVITSAGGSELSGFTDAAVKISSEFGGQGSHNNVLQNYDITNSSIGILIQDNSGVLGSTKVWNNTFINFTMPALSNTVSISQQAGVNTTIKDSSVGNGTQAAVLDGTLHAPPFTTPHLGLNFLNTTVSRASMISTGGTQDYYAFYWWFEPVCYQYGAPASTCIGNLTNSSGQGIFNWSQANSTILTRLFPVLEGYGNYTSFPRLYHNATPVNASSVATGFKNASNTTVVWNSSNITNLHLPILAPLVNNTAPLNSTNSTNRTQNFTWTNIAPAGDDWVNGSVWFWHTNGSLYLVLMNTSAIQDGPLLNWINYTFPANVPPTLLWNARACSYPPEPSCAFNQSNRTISFYNDTAPKVNLSMPTNYTNYTFTTLNVTFNVSFNYTPFDDHNFTNSSIWVWNASGLVGVFLNTTPISSGTPQHLMTALGNGGYNWTAQVCDKAITPQCIFNGTNRTFYITLTPQADEPPKVSLSAPANGTVFNQITFNTTFNTTFNYYTFDDYNFTNSSLWVWNASGTLIVILNLTQVLNGTLQTASLQLINGTYIWNAQDCDAAIIPQCAFNETNFTLVINMSEPPDFPPAINLNTPEDNNVTTNPAITFNTTPFDDWNFTNSSIWIWNASDDTLFAVILNQSALTNNTPLLTSFTLPLANQSWLWNAQVCDGFAGAAQCRFNNTNRTLNISVLPVPPPPNVTFFAGTRNMSTHVPHKTLLHRVWFRNNILNTNRR